MFSIHKICILKGNQSIKVKRSSKNFKSNYTPQEIRNNFKPNKEENLKIILLKLMNENLKL